MHHLRYARSDAGPASLCIIHCDFQRPKSSSPLLLCPYIKRVISCVVAPYQLLPGLLASHQAVAPKKRTIVKLQCVRVRVLVWCRYMIIVHGCCTLPQRTDGVGKLRVRFCHARSHPHPLRNRVDVGSHPRSGSPLTGSYQQRYAVFSLRSTDSSRCFVAHRYLDSGLGRRAVEKALYQTSLQFHPAKLTRATAMTGLQLSES